MREVSASDFFTAVEREFSFLTAAGFSLEKVQRGTGAAIIYVGKHVAVHLALDPAGDCIDCGVSIVTNGTAQHPPHHLHGFLVEHRGYRNSFSEFRPKESSDGPHVAELQMYAAALRELAPDIAADAAGALQ